MKKITRTILAAMLLISLLSGCAQEAAPAMAQTMETQTGGAGLNTVTGTVEASHTYPITAPFGGTLLAFDVRRGDTVMKNDAVFEIDTVKVYAPYSGIVRGVRAMPGDSAQAVQARYGALCSIEPEQTMIVRASTGGAYDRNDNKIIHIGETLYVKSRNNSRITDTGVVTSVSAGAYTVELMTNALEMDESVSLYRESDHRTDSKVGKGRVARSAPIPVNAQGSVLAVHVLEGQQVQKGDILFETSSSSIDSAAISNVIHAPQSGILGDIAVSAGQSVQKGQLLAAILDPADMYVAASVDEMDLGGLSKGDTVSIIFDSLPEKTFEGTIEAISGLGKQKQNASYYEVRVSFTPDSNVKLGMSATVCLPE